jgi:parallel beta-helix repeat protein
MIKADMHMQVDMHQDGMNRTKLLIVVIVVSLVTNGVSLLFSFETCKADTPITLYVGDGEMYTRIQDAIDHAFNGYRIFVYNGTYYENLTIDIRIDLFGEDRSITIINGNGTDTVITVNADSVNISHFTIINNGTRENGSNIHVNGEHSIITDTIVSEGYHGIVLSHSDGHLIYDNIICDNAGDGIQLNQSDDNINISYNTITGNRNGIYLYSSDGNKIYNNEIQHNNASGIFLNSTCQDNIIRNNNASDNNNHGMYLNDYSNYQTISNNHLYNNNNSGIVLENCSMNFYINGNTVVGNTNYGMMIIGSTNNVSSNTISHNNRDGLYFSADDNNTVFNNTISDNTVAGIRLYNSTDDYIYTNEISNNAYGAYLDFFTIQNTVYNNYFHENTRNAVDKSLARNMWNITKVSGTNVIGGGYRCGNYWDDYDELGEGAIDGNSDGIAESPYTIYAANKDYGALLDVTPPTIGTPLASPSSQSLGQYTNISVTVTDNTEIKYVYLNITDPAGQRSNFSITQNKTGNTYYCRKRFSPIGNYTYHIAAKDPRNWRTSTNYKFSIRPGEVPIIVDKSPTRGHPSSDFTFNTSVTLRDTSASDLRVYAVWVHGKKGGNYSMVHATGNYFELTVVLDNSIENLTYHIYATDLWGNDAVTTTKKIVINDSQLPVIRITRHGSSFEDLPRSYTFEALVTDDSVVSNVSIEYWYGDSGNFTAKMDAMGNDYYKKVIVPEGYPERVFCVISATDIAGNENNSKHPIASHGGPYYGFVLQEITFNGTGSFDLDGTISTYAWNFGDGTTGNGSTPTHTYYSNGTYTMTLTITDNDGNRGNNSTSVRVTALTLHKIPTARLAQINARYNLTLDQQFYCYDSDGDGTADTFSDPNHALIAVHDRSVNLSGNISFLLSIGDDDVPEFFWNTTTDTIVSIAHNVGIIRDTVINTEEEHAILYVTVDKEQWIYIEITDEYPDSPVTVTTGNRTISADMIWRTNGKIYVFDDPETDYQFLFESIFPELAATFSPSDGGVINLDSQTIRITYNVPVTIIYAMFGSLSIESELATTDNRVFTYTPPGYLENGTYPLEIDAQALESSGYLSSTVVYFYFAYERPPQQGFLEKNWMWILFGGFVGTLGGILIFFRVKQVTVDGSIYIKNRKIIPFFKPVIVGPVSVRIDDERLSKAQFYIDGQLKDETTTFPCQWQWNEKAFLKHTLETKVYDEEGNSISSGEMEFYIFNLSKEKET